MKRTMFVMAGVAVMLTGAYFASHLFAQAPAGSGTAPQVQGTRVAIVNIGLVFNQYVRAQAFKRELEELMKPFKTDGKKLMDEAVAWQEAGKKEADPKKREQFEQGVLHNKRKLEDLQRDMAKLIGKKQEDNLVTLWKDVNMGIERVAAAYGFQIVIGFGDPMEKDMLNLFPNINRKMQAMDMGASIPLYVHSSVDLSPIVADTLNKWADPKNHQVPGTTTSNPK